MLDHARLNNFCSGVNHAPENAVGAETGPLCIAWIDSREPGAFIGTRQPVKIPPGDAVYAAYNGCIVPDQWQHFAVTMDVAGNVKLYKNGKAQALEDQTNVGLAFNTVRRLNYMGKSVWGGDDKLYHGMMDDVRIYDAALEPDEIMAIYKGQEIPKPRSDKLPRLLTAAK